LFFSTSSILSKVVEEEINYALNKTNPRHKVPENIIIVFSKHINAKIEGKGIEKLKIYYINEYDINHIEKFKNDVLTDISKNHEKKNDETALGTVLVLGAIALIIAALSGSDKK
jgi:hypothetical protein